MAYDLIPTSLFNFPRFPSVFSDDDDWLSAAAPSGVSISEDDKHVFVSAHIPGVDEKDVDITFDKGMLWIKAESKEEEEDKKKKFYRKATSSFSYRVAVPGDLDLSAEPEAKYKNGVVTVSFLKSPQSQPKKITVKNK